MLGTRTVLKNSQYFPLIIQLLLAVVVAVAISSGLQTPYIVYYFNDRMKATKKKYIKHNRMEQRSSWIYGRTN